MNIFTIFSLLIIAILPFCVNSGKTITDWIAICKLTLHKHGDASLSQVLRDDTCEGVVCIKDGGNYGISIQKCPDVQKEHRNCIGRLSSFPNCCNEKICSENKAKIAVSLSNKDEEDSPEAKGIVTDDERDSEESDSIDLDDDTISEQEKKDLREILSLKQAIESLNMTKSLKTTTEKVHIKNITRAKKINNDSDGQGKYIKLITYSSSTPTKHNRKDNVGTKESTSPNNKSKSKPNNNTSKLQLTSLSTKTTESVTTEDVNTISKEDDYDVNNFNTISVELATDSMIEPAESDTEPTDIATESSDIPLAQPESTEIAESNTGNYDGSFLQGDATTSITFETVAQTKSTTATVPNKTVEQEIAKSRRNKLLPGKFNKLKKKPKRNLHYHFKNSKSIFVKRCKKNLLFCLSLFLHYIADDTYEEKLLKKRRRNFSNPKNLLKTSSRRIDSIKDDNEKQLKHSKVTWSDLYNERAFRTLQRDDQEARRLYENDIPNKESGISSDLYAKESAPEVPVTVANNYRKAYSGAKAKQPNHPQVTWSDLYNEKAFRILQEDEHAEDRRFYKEDVPHKRIGISSDPYAEQPVSEIAETAETAKNSNRRVYSEGEDPEELNALEFNFK